MVSKEELKQMKSGDMQFIVNFYELFAKVFGADTLKEQTEIRKLL